MIARRIATVGAFLAVGALTLAGCAASGEAPAASEAPKEDIELSMLVNITPNLTEEWWNELVAPFEEANPHIDVVIQAPTQEGVRKMIPQLLASGNVPDVIQSAVPTPDLAPELVDLSEYEWASEGPMAAQYALDGKNYNAMIGYQLQSIMFYNKQAFEDAGIDSPPETLEELDADLKKLKDAGWTPIQTGGDWFTQMTANSIGIPSVLAENPDWFADMNSGDLTFSDTWTDTIERYAGWVEKGYIPADAVGTKYPDAEAAFLAGKAAIYPMGSWFAPAAAKAADAPEIGVFRTPGAKGVKNPAMGAGGASSYVVMKQGKNPDAAAELVEFLVTDQDAVSAQLSVDGNYRAGYEYEMTDLQKELLAIVEATPVESFSPVGDGYGSQTVPLGYNAELNTQLQSILTGATGESVIAAMDAWFEANRP